MSANENCLEINLQKSGCSSTLGDINNPDANIQQKNHC